jgi:membrane-associated phospholipid phosphatase
MWVKAITLFVLGALLPASAFAQFRLEPRDGKFWLTGAAALTAAVALDARLASLSQQIETPGLDRFARKVGVLGQARLIVPSLALGIIVPRITGDRSMSNAGIRVAAGYFAADALTSLLKPIIGRHRPDTLGRPGDPGRFRPLRGTSTIWRSMPSGHTTHAFALATALSIETNKPWVTASAYSVASLVGVQRIYTRAHWGSDVAAGAVLSMAVSATVVRWLERSHGSLARH